MRLFWLYYSHLGYAAKFKTERARTALVKIKARQIIKEFAPTNPVYYEKLRERLEKIIEEKESRRLQDASYFNKIIVVSASIVSISVSVLS